MNARLGYWFVTLLVLAGSTAFGQGGGLVLYENGSPDMGSSYAGAGARAEDAFTAFANPAGMTRIDGNQVLLGGLAMITEFELDLRGGTVSVPPGSFDGGGDLGQFLPGFGTYSVVSLTDDLKLGLTVNVLAGNGVEYEQAWVGRTFIVDNQIVVANFMPSLAYRINDQFSIGGGLNVAYMSLEQSLLASSAIGAPTIQIDDADDFAFAGTFGLLYQPNDRTRFGLTYRSELSFSLEGKIDLPAPISLNFDSDMDLPQGVNASVYHQLTDTFALLADAGWSDWSTFDRQPTSVGPVSFDIPRDWKDTWRVGAGLQWDFSESWLLRSGFSYDSSPIEDDKRLPDAPVGEQYRFSVGVQKDFGQGKVFGVSYTFIYAPLDMDAVPLPGGIVLDGEYDPSYIHIFGINATISF